MDGYIKLHRKALENGWLQNPYLWTFWTWCLLKASHKKHTQTVGLQRVTLQPGQFVFGRKKASKELKMGEKRIRNIITFLEKSQNVAIKRASKFSIISIVNWGNYQSNGRPSGPSKGPAGGHQGATDKKGKEIKDIVEYLNLQTGKAFKATTESTQQFIGARLKDGYTIEDFKKVIDVKTAKWLNDPKMSLYLRPSTLFNATKFEGYVNEVRKQKWAT